MTDRARVVRLTAIVVVAAALTGCGLSRLLEPSRETVLARILPSAVQIVVEQQEGRRIRTGSGVAIAARSSLGTATCFVLTSGHTFSGLEGRMAVFALFGRHRSDGRKVAATVLVHRDNADVDLAVLRAESPECIPAQPGRASLGAPVLVVGFPWGRHLTLASGVVSQLDARNAVSREAAARFMVDATVSYGTSGSGVFDARSGTLIGIVEGYRTARVTAQGTTPAWYIDVPVPGQTFVTPLGDIRRFLDETGHSGLLDEGPRASAPSSIVAGRTGHRGL